MQTLIKLGVAIMVLLFTTGIKAQQEFQGVATYKSKRKVNIQLDSTQVNSDLQAQIMERLKKQFERTYLLTFNKEASIYKEEETLGAPQPAVGGSGVQVFASFSGASDVLYKNTKENRYANQSETFGKIFLVQDELEKYDWKLTQETKNIGQYTCYKATRTDTRTVTTAGNFSNVDDEDSEPETRTEEVTITAWYTPQIPVSTGPGNYHGLPGLILEANDGSEVVICSKIVLNPEETIEIKEPEKGKKVNQDEFNEIVQKKAKEMSERFRSNRPGDGNSFQIRIGG